MLATTAEAPLDSAALAYEPKYDGIRAIVAIDPPSSGRGQPAVRFWSRLGNEKTTQFPEIREALAGWAGHLDRPVLVDGELVALDRTGTPTGFQKLQGRIHRKDVGSVPAPDTTALILFDVLRDGADDVRGLPLRERRARLERLLAAHVNERLRMSEQVVGNGREMFDRAQALGWEGLIAKRLESPYQSGRRSPDWSKLKLVRRQACVVGGWTAPRGSRPFLGALLLGVYDADGALEYVGHSGAGFSDAELGRVWKRLQAVKTKTSPFAKTPKTNERPHWARPALVAEVKFTEWTADGKLRHPTYLGLRDDLRPEQVRKEPDTVTRKTAKKAATSPARAGSHQTLAGSRPRAKAGAPTPAAVASGVSRKSGRTTPAPGVTRKAVDGLLKQLDTIQDAGGNGALDIPGGGRLEVTNLGKVYFPSLKLTKGDVYRHYVRVAPALLAALADRPLVMKRYPNGIAAKPFYQHRAPDKVPPGIRVAVAGSGTERRPHLIGGDLLTLLYTAQLGAISQDPWFSRVGSEEFIDHVAIDLDPPEDLPFAKVLDVARWVRDALVTLGAPGFPKTSGSSGVHIYIPMPPQTPYDAGLLFGQIVATMVARQHPKLATVERSVAARGRRVYVDYLQNIRAKTLASVYSLRANEFAGVSTPVTWKEIDAGLSPRDFTLTTFAERLDEVGDLWAALRKAKPPHLGKLPIGE
jgi:bifunctional non-homologous end joining protein LigD